MKPLVNKTASVDDGTAVYPASRCPIDMLANVLVKAGLPRENVDYHHRPSRLHALGSEKTTRAPKGLPCASGGCR
jgi:hypothetical protein